MSALRLEIAAGSQELAAGARSHAYHHLAAALDFPTPQLAGAVSSGRWLADLTALALHLPFDFEPVGSLSDGGLGYPRMQQEYIQLFEVGPGRPFCPLYEGSHRRGRMKIMEELVRFYQHFGLRSAPGDQPDHLCVELEFMHYLAFKEAAALTSGGEARGLALAQEDFLARHLIRWLPKVVALLESRPDTPAFYGALVAITSAFCRADLAWLRGRRENPDTEIGSLPD